MMRKEKTINLVGKYAVYWVKPTIEDAPRNGVYCHYGKILSHSPISEDAGIFDSSFDFEDNNRPIECMEVKMVAVANTRKEAEHMTWNYCGSEFIVERLNIMLDIFYDAVDDFWDEVRETPLETIRDFRKC